MIGVRSKGHRLLVVRRAPEDNSRKIRQAQEKGEKKTTTNGPETLS